MATHTNESLGELVGQATAQFSDLVRQEMALARAEIRQEVGKVARGAGMFGGAGITAWLGVLFLSLAAMFGLAEVVPPWAAALAVGIGYAVTAVLLAATGAATFGSVSPVPRRTVETLKEDVEWARHRGN